MDLESLQKHISKEIDITEILIDLYYKATITRLNYIYDNNIDVTSTPVAPIAEFMIDELYVYYDLNEDEVDIEYTSADTNTFKASINKLLAKGYTNIGLLPEESTGDYDVVLVGIKKPQDLGLLKDINEPDDPNQEPIQAALAVLISNEFRPWEEPFIQVNGNFIEINLILGDKQPSGFDFMKYLILYKNNLIKLIENTVGIKPFYAKVIRNSYYGEMNIRYEITDMDALIGLLKIKNLPISYLR